MASVNFFFFLNFQLQCGAHRRLHTDYSSWTLHACYVTSAEAALWYSAWSWGVCNLPCYSLNIGLVPHRYVFVPSVWVLDFVFVGKNDRPTAVKGPETEPGGQKERHLGHEDNKIDFFFFWGGEVRGGEAELWQGTAKTLLINHQLVGRGKD